MNPYFKQSLCFAGAVILATTGLAQDFAVDSFALDGGGGTSSGGVFEMSGTIRLSQPDAMTGGVFSVEGVFESLVSVVPPLPPEPITIFDNTTGSDNGGSGVTATAWLASRFCLGSQSYQLASVSLLLNSQDFSGGAGPPAVVQLQIYASDPVTGKPSTNTGLFMNLSSHTNPVALVRGQQFVRWTNATPFTLVADTCYWAVLSRESGGRAFVGAVDVLHVAPSQRHDEFWYGCCFFGSEQQVHMIGHQRVGMQLTFVVYQRFTQPVQVAGIVALAKEAWLAVVSALHDVERDTIDLDAGTPGNNMRLP